MRGSYPYPMDRGVTTAVVLHLPCLGLPTYSRPVPPDLPAANYQIYLRDLNMSVSKGHRTVEPTQNRVLTARRLGVLSMSLGFSRLLFAVEC